MSADKGLKEGMALGGGVKHFTPSFCFPRTFFSLILKKKSCLLATLIFLDNSRKWQLAVRKRKMTSKYGLPIVAVRWTDCDSGTPIFWSVSFLGGVGGGICCRGPASVLLFPCNLLSAMMGDQSGIVFSQMSQYLKMESE